MLGALLSWGLWCPTAVPAVGRRAAGAWRPAAGRSLRSGQPAAIDSMPGMIAWRIVSDSGAEPAASAAACWPSSLAT